MSQWHEFEVSINERAECYYEFKMKLKSVTGNECNLLLSRTDVMDISIEINEIKLHVYSIHVHVHLTEWIIFIQIS